MLESLLLLPILLLVFAFSRFFLLSVSYLHVSLCPSGNCSTCSEADSLVSLRFGVPVLTAFGCHSVDLRPIVLLLASQVPNFLEFANLRLPLAYHVSREYLVEVV